MMGERTVMQEALCYEFHLADAAQNLRKPAKLPRWAENGRDMRVASLTGHGCPHSLMLTRSKTKGAAFLGSGAEEASAPMARQPARVSKKARTRWMGCVSMFSLTRRSHPA